MGNKCRFCNTFFGKVKRVAGVLQGNGCDCYGCNGQFSGKMEIDLAIKYYEEKIRFLEEHKKSIDQFIKENEEIIEQLRKLEPVHL